MPDRTPRQRVGDLVNQVVRRIPVPGRLPQVERQVYLPIPQPDEARELRKLRRGLGKTFYCNVCGQRSLLTRFDGDFLRETINCFNCDAYNKQRQLAAVLLHGSAHRSLADFVASQTPIRVYNTEIDTSLDRVLRHLPNYTCSEYFAKGKRSGDVLEGKLHQDLQATSFPDDSFDLVISADVFEHIPKPYRAHQEIWRILAPGGRHVMSVPFHHDGFQDERLVDKDRGTGKARHRHGAPIYHGDTRRSKGVLTYTIFGLQSLVKLSEMGFAVRMFNLRAPKLGIVGRQAFIFELTKPATPPSVDSRRREKGYY